MTPNQLADELGVSAKVLRAWLRRTWPRTVGEHGTEWELTIEQIKAARTKWGGKSHSPLRPEWPRRE
jgi:predicted site-specific integrase-resolvase